jgi:hypothetical protein
LYRIQMAVSLVPSALLVIRGYSASRPVAERSVGVLQVVALLVLVDVWMMVWLPLYRYQMAVSLVPSALLVICGA